MVVSMTQLGTYDQTKTMLTPIMGDNKGTHLVSALTAAVVYSFASLPLVSDRTALRRTHDWVATIVPSTKTESRIAIHVGLVVYVRRTRPRLGCKARLYRGMEVCPSIGVPCRLCPTL